LRKQNEILRSSRPGQITNLDFTSVGGLNTTPGAGSNPLIPFPQSVTGYLVNPGVAAPARAFFPGCTSAAQAANQCTFVDPGLQIQPTSMNMDILSKFTIQLNDDWQSTTTASVFRSGVTQYAFETQGGYTNTGYPSGPEIPSLPPGQHPHYYYFPVITVPASYPGNPYGVAAPLVYTFRELGSPYYQYYTNTYRLIEDMNGKVAGWDIAASMGYMYALNRDDMYNGYFDPIRLQNALNDDYLLGGSLESQVFGGSAEATSSSYLYTINADAGRKLLDLPGGNLALAFGSEWYEQRLNSISPAEDIGGTPVIAGGYQIGSQANSAGYAELRATAFNRLEGGLSLRYDHYNTAAGGDTTPKIGLKWKPVEGLVFRGTWGKGFRAPSIAETNSAQNSYASTTNDRILCPTNNPTAPGTFPSQCSVQLNVDQSGNPNLKPEKSTNYTFGVIFEPTKELSVSANYYDIKIDHDIIDAFEAGGLGYGGYGSIYRLGPLVTLPQVQANGSLASVQTPVPLMSYESYPFINASQTETNGVDVDLRSKVDLGVIGNLTTSLSYTRILVYRLEANGVAYELAGTHGPSVVSGDTGNPKTRATLTFTWDKGPFSATTTINYIGSYGVTDPSAGQFTCAQALYNAPTYEFGSKFLPGASFPESYCTVASFTDVDFYVQWRLNDHLSTHLSVIDLLDKPPSFDAVTYGGGTAGASYSAGLEQVGAVGRFFTVGAEYRFR
jgi:iron complex outermembrane recepter protein